MPHLFFSLQVRTGIVQNTKIKCSVSFDLMSHFPVGYCSGYMYRLGSQSFCKKNLPVLMTVKGKKRFQRQETILKRLIYALPTTLMGQNLHVALRTDTNQQFEGTYLHTFQSVTIIIVYLYCASTLSLITMRSFTQPIVIIYLVKLSHAHRPRPLKSQVLPLNPGGLLHHSPPQNSTKKTRFRVAISVKCFCKQGYFLLVTIVIDNDAFINSRYCYYLLGQVKPSPSATPTQNAATQGVHSTIPPKAQRKKAHFKVAISVVGIQSAFVNRGIFCW